MIDGGPRSARFGDLGLRVVSGLVLAAIAFANVWAGGAWATAFLSLALVLMLWEYHRMVTGDGRTFAPSLVVSAVAGTVALGATAGWSAGHGLVCLAAGAFVVALAARRWAPWMTAGFLYMTLAMGALLVLRAKDEGVWLILWMVLVVVATDVGAYFVGRAVGGAKLWPAVSPGKTRSGAVGGVAAAALTGIVFAITMDWHPIRIGILSVGISVCAQAGDLLESAVKRRFGVKDASALIPGHGGVMDRLDGIMGGVWFFGICDALGVGVIGS
jgi:phosphatidate cytidylyltransferase